MPLRSKAQRAYLAIHDPVALHKLASETTPEQMKALPERVPEDDHLGKQDSRFERVLRCDRSRLAKHARTAQGFVRVDARLTRTGILEYRNPDGSVRHELRPPEEVFAPASLESLNHAPVTDMHPPEMIRPANVKQYSVGVTTAPRADGKFVAARLIVQEQDTITRIDSGDREEVSCGYACDIDPTPGVYDGQSYDVIQRNIQYNHVAIGPKHWGRAGAEVALRLDAADVHTPALVARFDDESDSSDNGDNPRTKTQGDQLMTIKINGVELKLDERDVAIVSAELQRLNERADAAEAKAAKAQEAAGASEAKAAAAVSRADAAEKRVAKVERAELEASARPVLGTEYKFDGQSDSDVRRAVVAKALPTVRLDGADDAFVRGAYASAVQVAAAAAESARQAAAESGVGRSDAGDDPDKAREDMIAARRKMALSQQ